MLSKNLYELLLEKYLDFKTYLTENKNNKDDRELYDTIQNFLITEITEEKYTTRYNIYKSLMDLLKKKYELSDLTDDEFVNEMVLRYGKSKSIFDEDVDFDTFTNIYANYIEYDEENLKDIDTFIKEDLKDIDYSMREDFLLNNCSLDYFKSPEFVNKLLKLWINFEDVLEYVSDEVRNDKDYFAKIKVKEFPSLIGEKLLNDEDFILENLDKIEYKYISDELKHNKNFIVKLMTKAPSLFYCIDEKFRDDKEIVLKVLEETRRKSTRMGKIVIREIVSPLDYGFLEHVSDRLKNDPEIIEKALECNIDDYKFLPKKYKNDKKMIEKVLSIDEAVARYLDDEIKKDSKYLEELYLKYDFSIVYTNSEIIHKYANDKDIMKKEIYKNDDAIDYLSDELFNDKKYIINVIEDDPLECAYYNDRLIKAYKNDEEVMFNLVKRDNYYIRYVGKRLQKKLVKMLNIDDSISLDEEDPDYF